ncbi:amidase [Streptomyces sp. NPDC090994]|uniref:amidase n=1 Tax=Streptomyces sp. NPDC090994 TaxID=3365969 RepID=UPI003807C51A
MHPTVSALGIASLVAAKQVSPIEVARFCLDRLDRLNPLVNAIVWRDDEQLLRAAEAAEQRVMSGEPLPPFLGVPVPVKELTQAAGQPNTLGSLGISDVVQKESDVCIDRLTDAGMLLMGRSNAPEMGPMSVSENRRYGATANPWDPSYSAGGSSGGAAAAVAAGLAPVAQASDGGGSIRMPSSCCGTVGLKPSRGRVPMAAPLWEHGVTDGMITRTVADAAALLDVLAAPDPLAWDVAAPLRRPLADEVGAAPGRLRIGLLTEAPTGLPVDPDCVRAAQRLAAVLEDFGHVVEPAEFTGYSPEAVQGYLEVVINAWLWTTDYDDVSLAEPYLRHRRRLGTERTAAEYARAAHRIHRESRDVVRQWQTSWDVLLTPTMATTPPPLGVVLDEANRDPDGPRLTENQMVSFTAFANIAGLPAISLPVHSTGSGLPVGAQLIGGPADEATLIRLASQVEPAFSWTTAIPDVFA